MSRLVAVGIAALLLLGSAGAPPVAAQDSQATSMQTPDGFDQTTFRVTVFANGSAEWAIQHRTPLQNDSEAEQFEAFATEFENSETQLYSSFVEQSKLLSQYGTNATGREMSTSNFDRSATVNPLQSTGTVTMSFHWSNFAIMRADSLVVSDVFDGGFYIGPSQSFVFERGPTLVFTDVVPTPDSQSTPNSLEESETVTWNGERSFNDRRPFVELKPRPSNGETAATQATETSTESEPAGTDGSSPAWMLPLAIAVVVLGLGGVAVWRTGGGTGLFGDDDDGDGRVGTAATDASAAQAGSRAPSQSAPSADNPDPEPAVTDEELLTDSDRVIGLLEDNGGRMKQVDIVDRTDWSKSKVSMLLSDMEEDGEITKLRVGRENIISLTGQEPDAAGSPFEDE